MVRTLRWLALLPILLMGSASSGQELSEGRRREARPFSIPQTRVAASLRDRAEEHVAARRWSEALSDLQALIEAHEGELLPGRTRDDRGRVSHQPVHEGAVEYALRRLRGLPEEARLLYAERHARASTLALDQARRSGRRSELAEVARRWPICPAAMKAWWTLGDLELESGNPRDAVEAWRRGLEILELAGGSRGPGIDRRMELARELTDTGAGVLAELEASQPPAAGLRLPGPGEGQLSIPATSCAFWRYPLEPGRSEPLIGSAGAVGVLFPTLWGERLYVSTSLRLLCLDAYSGELLWASAEPPGWNRVRRSDFYEGIHEKTLLIAPAAAAGVAVAALQIPVTQSENRDYDRIKITRIIPDRRLFAFDARTGEDLWNHMPPEDWDGEGGCFSERMFVAGPPVIAGTRLLVPAYRMQGRIDYHVACFELTTGALLWSANLISGQRELNMFGRHQEEFCAPPVRVEGHRVIALTQLGALAALDLFTGEVLWETLYEQYPLKGAVHWNPSIRTRVWDNAPAVVADGMVIAGPTDSPDLIGVELDSGTLLWSIPQERLIGRAFRSDDKNLVLLGATEDTVYLGGHTILALRSGTGLHSTVPPQPTQPGVPAQPVLSSGLTPLPRAALADRFLVVPTSQGRVALDRHRIDRQDPRLSGPWPGGDGRGNILLADGAAFAIGARAVHGFFDWQQRIERYQARLEEDPDDPALAASYAALLSSRAVEHWRSGLNQGALADISLAREVLEPFARGDRLERDVSQRLHLALRTEALVRTELAQPAVAIDLLRRARELAPDAAALRDVLLQEIELLRDRDPSAWEEAIEILASRCESSQIPDSHLPFQAAAASRRSDFADRGESGLPVGLWAQLELARGHAAAGKTQRELEDLHAIAQRYGDIAWPPPDGPTVHERIAARVEEVGRRSYEPFEQRARALLDRALEEGDLAGLQRVIDVYPLSRAAIEAEEARLEVALRSGDAATAARIVLGPLPDDWSPRRSTEAQARSLLRLAGVLGEGGNRALERAVLSALARELPELTSPIEAHGGATLAALARDLTAPADRPMAAEHSDFLPGDARTRAEPGEYVLLGRTFPAGEGPVELGEPILLLARKVPDAAIVALPGPLSGEEGWSYPVRTSSMPRYWDGRCAFTPERIAFALENEVVALDPRDGRAAWRWLPLEGSVLSVREDSGVCLVLVRGSDRSHRITALDAHGGVGLWTAAVPGEYWQDPVCGGGKAVLLPNFGNQVAQVVELLTGTVSLEIDIGRYARVEEAAAAWIDHGRLILPSFSTSATRTRKPEEVDVEAWDLERGARAWHVPRRAARELYSIARAGASTYLVYRPPSTSVSGMGGVVDLNTRSGAHREIQGVRIARDDWPIGLPRFQTLQLEAPWLFLYSPEGAERTRIRAIHLPFGERWVHQLSEPMSDVWPLPALSRNTVALCYNGFQHDRPRLQPRASLLLLDRQTGVRQDLSNLPVEMGDAKDLDLRALGDALLIRGRKGLRILRRQR